MRIYRQIAACLTLLSSAISVADEPTAGEKLFALRVQPLLTEKCGACHGDNPDEIESGLDVRSRQAMLNGGEAYGDEVLIPGRGTESLLYLVTTRSEPGYEMPPKEADRLSEEQTGWIRDWIDAGAPWPDDDRVAMIREAFAEGVRVATSGGLSDDWTNRRYEPNDLWAYRPLVRPQLPTSAHADIHPVDAFVNAHLDARQLAPAPPADARTLIRRATFDLTGLPPRLDEVDAFVAAFENDPEVAWHVLIDRLLDSRHYGEQWGRHWLDVVRYADSSGFANDYERPNAWRYRDYVIRSFNNDKPYDEFVREQIAGDEIGQHPTAEQRIATGFLRMGPWEHTAMSVAKITRQQFLDDVTDSVGQVFLAHALQCARCHDHKFDPVPTRDYYSMQAIFATTQFADVPTEWLPDENLNGMEQDRHYHEQRKQYNKRRLDQLAETKRQYEAEWFAERGLPWKSKEEAKAAGAKPAELPSGRMFRKAEEFGLERIGRKWQKRFAWELERYQPVAFTVYSGKTRVQKDMQPQRLPNPESDDGELEMTAILKGGDPFSPDQPVSPAVLSAVPGGRLHPVPQAIDGRRLALANWIVDPRNTLTARVMVNRIWQYHFGQAIAGNPNNFGATGKKPSHPKLLDWLAVEFIERGWSIKQMHRVIMTSAAYRRASSHPDPQRLGQLDPSGDLFAVFRPRRLTAEELRDAMLFASGELNVEQGGIPIRPDMNLEAALQPRMIMGTFAPSYVPNAQPEQRNRRTIYAHKTRGHRDPFLEVFNQPGPDKSCEMRDSSNVTPQVFTLLNSQESMDRSLAMADRILQEQPGRTDESAVQRAFALAFGRQPMDDERDAAVRHWREMEVVQSNRQPTPREFPTEVSRVANEENTGETFTFTERLFIYDDYVPDLQAHQVDARTRALADLCLVLLNSNEFVFVY